MKTDSLFYRIFQTAPALFFELIGQPDRQGYTFASVEVKQTAHRIDGVFRPPANRPQDPVFFTECQFQTDHYLYHRLFAEVFLFLEQNPAVSDWSVVVLYLSRKLEPRHTQAHRALLNSPQVQRIYLNELGPPTTQPLSTGLMQLLVLPKRQTPRLAQQLITQTETSPSFPPEMILELIIAIMVYQPVASKSCGVGILSATSILPAHIGFSELPLPAIAVTHNSRYYEGAISSRPLTPCPLRENVVDNGPPTPSVIPCPWMAIVLRQPPGRR